MYDTGSYQRTINSVQMRKYECVVVFEWAQDFSFLVQADINYIVKSYMYEEKAELFQLFQLLYNIRESYAEKRR